MILNYKFKNFMSFCDNVEFSMLAPKTKVKSRFPDNFVASDNGIDILKTAVIVGENAGGKSNFVKSLYYFQSFFRETETVKSYRNTINANNMQDLCPQGNNTLQVFTIEILTKENMIYRYHLEIDFSGIVKEVFHFKKQINSKYKQIFSFTREECAIKCDGDKENCERKNGCKAQVHAAYSVEMSNFSSEIKESLQKSTNMQKAFGLTIMKLAMLGDEHAAVFVEWMKERLCPETNIINYDIYKSMRSEDDDLRILHDPRYLDIFRMVDYSIIDFKIDEEKPFSKTSIVREKKDGSFFSKELSKDSSGVREFFAWAVQIFKVVYENKIVFADEMDRALNPVLSDRVVSFICGKNHFGQFIFTTHNVLHLDLKTYMKEQIYFITKENETLESEMYSLADFPEIRYETSKVYEFYMKGVLGGTAFE